MCKALNSIPSTAKNNNKKRRRISKTYHAMGWGCNSMVEHLPFMCKAPGIVSSTERKKKYTMQTVTPLKKRQGAISKTS
jgi:hypothetical protein